MRAMGSMSAVPDRELPRLLAADGYSNVVLALEAETHAGTRAFLAVARVFAGPIGKEAEFAVIVRSDHLGQRLGERMMQALIAWARELGLKALVAETLPENTRMLGLAKRMGFERHWDSQSHTMRLRLELGGSPADSQRRHSDPALGVPFPAAPGLPALPAEFSNRTRRQPPPLRLTALVALLSSLLLLPACSRNNDSTENANPASTPTTAPAGWRGTVQSVTDVAVVTRKDSDTAAIALDVAALAGPAICDVRVQSVVHATAGPRDEVTKNSAALLIPQGVGCAGPFPLIAYARGTSKDRARTLANPADREASLLIVMFAARGFIVVATDYLGYAQSSFPYHPYLHAGSEASSVIDSIRAARAVLKSAAVATNGKVLLAGYSQGGHAALAALREIERTAGSDIAVSAVGAMSGPYDLALSLSSASAALMPSLADENPNPTERARILLVDVLADVAGFFSDLGLIRDLIGRQSVVDFAPVAPLLLCGGARDLTVPFANTTTAAATFAARGSRVTLVDIDQEPTFAALRPPPGTPASGLSSYHSRVVPPLCFQVVRERLFK